jgi:hypothetical protein
MRDGGGAKYEQFLRNGALMGWGIAAALMMIVAAAWPTRWLRLVPAALCGGAVLLGARGEGELIDRQRWLIVAVVGAAVIAASGIRAVRRCFAESAEIWVLMAVVTVALGLAVGNSDRLRWLAAGLVLAAAVELVRRDTLVAGTVGMFIAAMLWVVARDATTGPKMVAGMAALCAIGPVGWGLRVTHPTVRAERWVLALPWLAAALVAAALARRGDTNAQAVVRALTCYVVVLIPMVWHVRRVRGASAPS